MVSGMWLLSIRNLLAGLSFISLVSTHTLILHEKRHESWGGDPSHADIDRRRIEKHALLPMRIGLKQNEHASSNAEKWLMEVSHPESPSFGRHWTQEQVIQTFQPSEETTRTVTEWLHSHNVTEFTHSDNKLWFAFDLPVEKAEAMLKTEYFEHETKDGKGFEASCNQYYLPAHLQKHVHYITPGVKSGDVTGRTLRSRSVKIKIPDYFNQKYNRTRIPHILPPYDNLTSLEHCSKVVTPACVRALYNFSAPDASLPVNPNNTLGIFEADNDIYYQGDLDLFYQYFAPNIPNGTAPYWNRIDGAAYPPNVTHGLNWQLVGDESDLDLQASLPIIYPQNVSIFQVSSDDEFGGPAQFENFYNRFLDAVDGSYCSPSQRENSLENGKPECGVFKPPNVMSVSWVSPEMVFPPLWQERQCDEYLKLGLQGVSLLFCSGDYGVGALGMWSGRKPQGCEAYYDSPAPRIFMPAFPASCPWVTSVGATEIRPGNTPFDPESGAEWTSVQNNTHFWTGASGGGFSLHFPAPPYQKEALASYFENHDPAWPYFHLGRLPNSTAGRYRREGRGIPDISAIGRNYADFWYNTYTGASGTSVATPVVASLINRIVEERMRAGKGRLGFLNPTLYKHPGAFNDITKGRNGFCARDQGFTAVPGWDPMTGLGTPKYPELLDIFMKLP